MHTPLHDRGVTLDCGRRRSPAARVPGGVFEREDRDPIDCTQWQQVVPTRVAGADRVVKQRLEQHPGDVAKDMASHHFKPRIARCTVLRNLQSNSDAFDQCRVRAS